MGDTLAGMITSFVGQFDNLKEAVMSATYTHSFLTLWRKPCKRYVCGATIKTHQILTQ